MANVNGELVGAILCITIQRNGWLRPDLLKPQIVRIEIRIDLNQSARQPIGRFPDDAFVTSGDFDRSISLPGTPGSFRIGGLVQVNANFD
ncbi:MAG: hypothetical protein AAFS13_02785, partial [Pseudomonadota bacterium]